MPDPTDDTEDETDLNPLAVDEDDIDPEYEERRRMVEYLSTFPEGLTGSEVRDIMNGD